jgi:hypothetical protein
MKFQARPKGGEWIDRREETIEHFALQRCGGGWTTSQTAKAMAMMASIRAGKVWSGHNIEIRALPAVMEA